VKLLLDTQVVLWWLAGSRRLGAAARERIASSYCVLSAASVWEVAIKYAIGKLPASPQAFRDELVIAGVDILPITDAHAIATAALPAGHSDPFDRLLVAVARLERARLLTADASLLRYVEGLDGVAAEAP
jgi:PIN domain nuclease of toxin-antitoxin system